MVCSAAVFLVALLVGADTVQCLEPPACVLANSTCGDCYNYLVYNLLKSDENHSPLSKSQYYGPMFTFGRNHQTWHK